jgi:hypothetical protein
MSIPQGAKYTWDDATSAAPHWRTFLRNHTTELQKKEIAFVNDAAHCNAIMEAKLPRLLGEPAMPLQAGTAAQNKDAHNIFVFAENRWKNSKNERVTYRADQARFLIKTNLALTSFEDFFESSSTIGVFIARHEKEVNTAFAASQELWQTALALHMQDPMVVAQLAAANVPALDYFQDEGNASLLPAALQGTYDAWRACYRDQHPYSRYKVIWAKLSDLFATGKKSQKHVYEAKWLANDDSLQTARAYLDNEELWIELINEASDVPLSEEEKEDKMWKS